MGARASRIIASLVAVVLFWGAQRAVAHQDPPGCATTGLAFGVAVFRADGVTPIAGNQTVSPCETVQYQFTVQYRTGTADCGFQGGSMILQTPDGVFHNTTPAGGVPLISPFDGVTSVDGTKVSYTVRAQDIVGGKVQANAFYGCALGANNPTGCTDPTEHTGPGDSDTLGFPTGSTGIPRGVTPCPLSTQCRTSLCDPTLQGTGADAGRMGLCTFTPVPDSTPCSADNAGNSVTAIPGSCKTPGCEAGECVQAHINVTDSTPCTDTDNNACTMAGCEAGSCVQTHVVKQRLGCRGRR